MPPDHFVLLMLLNQLAKEEVLAGLTGPDYKKKNGLLLHKDLFSGVCPIIRVNGKSQPIL